MDGKLQLVRQLMSLAHLRPDVVHFEWESAAVHYLPLADVLRCPVVMSCRGAIEIFPHTPLAQRWAGGLPLAFRTAAAVHCVSHATKRAAVREGLDPAKAWVITPAVDPYFFSPPERVQEGGDVMRLVAAGWLRWGKGWEYALGALRRLVDEGVPARLDIFGDDPGPDHGEYSERERILCTVADLQLGSRVHLHGPVGPSELRSWLHRAHALLHASLAEGIPNIVLEAMSCALPVVAADCGGVREAVTDGVEGFVLAPRDAGGLSRALRALWRDPALRRRMGMAGRARITSTFTLAEQSRRFAALYEAVLSGAAA